MYIYKRIHLIHYYHYQTKTTVTIELVHASLSVVYFMHPVRRDKLFLIQTSQWSHRNLTHPTLALGFWYRESNFVVK